MSNVNLNLAEFRAGKTVLSSKPRYVLVELTRSCNLRCPMCRSGKSEGTIGRMPHKLFERIAHELFPTAELVDLRGWGESLLLKDFSSYVSQTASYGSNVRLVTNLSVACTSALLSLARVNAYVEISMDSAEPSVASLLRPGINSDLVVANAIALSKLYASISGSVARLCFRCTLQRPALQSLSKLADVAANCGIPKIKLAQVRTPVSSPLSLSGYEQATKESVQHLIAVARERGVSVVACSDLAGCNMSIRPDSRCYHPWGYASISADGLVNCCDNLIGPRFDACALGNLRNETFESIWNGPRWTAIRQAKMYSNATYAHCTKCFSCCRDRRIDFEDLFVPEWSRKPSILTDD